MLRFGMASASLGYAWSDLSVNRQQLVFFPFHRLNSSHKKFNKQFLCCKMRILYYNIRTTYISEIKMIEIYLLEQLIALDDCGTLSEAAKRST